MKRKPIYFYAGLILLYFAIAPFHVNPGSILLLFAALFFISSLKWSQKWRKRMLPLFIVGIIAFTAYMGTLFYFGHCRTIPTDLQNETVIVLGCKVNGDRPSQMLRRRLDAAVEYLHTNPDANCIVTGGQGYNESYTEASVMAAYLESTGIESSRIYQEDRSTNTRQNLEFSQTIIEEKQLNKNILIVSDGYHQFRAHLIANKLGMVSYALSGHTSWRLIPAYSVREIFSLIKLIPFFLS